MTTITELDPNQTHHDIGDTTHLFTPAKAHGIALLWCNDQRALSMRDGREYKRPLTALIAGARGSSDLCPLALSARMRSVGETTAAQCDVPHFISHTVDIPPAVQAFQAYFDAGAYPNLISSAGDAVETSVDEGLSHDAHWSR